MSPSRSRSLARAKMSWSPRTAPLFHLAPGELFAGTCLAAVLLVAGTRDYETRFPERRVMRDYSATVIATTNTKHLSLFCDARHWRDITPPKLPLIP